MKNIGNESNALMASTLTERQLALYEYLVSQPEGRRISKREIFENVDGYEWHEDCSDKCPSIRVDMKAINAEPAAEKLIVFDKQEYFIPDKEWALIYRRRKTKSIKTLVSELKCIDRKIKRSGQGELDSKGQVAFRDPYAEESEEEKAA